MSMLQRISSALFRTSTFSKMGAPMTARSANPDLMPKISKHEYDTKTIQGAMPDDADQAVGLERWEYEQKAAGNLDPFGMNAVELKDGMGTKENPIIVPSYEDERIIGYTSDQMDEVIWFAIQGDGTVARGPTGEFYKLKVIPAPF